MNKGQSLVEIVFSIGLISLVLTGVVSLLISTIGARSKSYDRNMAVELSQIVMENLLSEEKSDPESFWNLGSTFWVNMGTTQVDVNFPNYTYSVTATAVTTSGCSATKLECLNAKVEIFWKDGYNLDRFNRFFSRK